MEVAAISGKFVVGVVSSVMLAIAGGLIFYARPKLSSVLLLRIQTSTGTMVLVQAGRFLHGEGKETGIAPAFYIDQTEVSNESYGAFCKATGHPLPPGFASLRPTLPVTDITISDATLFAKWAGKRLPDALEWEKAARGTEGRLYPWGNEPIPQNANVADGSSHRNALMDVNSLPAGASPYQAYHMVGNAMEFVRNATIPDRAAQEHFVSLLQPPPGKDELWFSAKGGSYQQPLREALPWMWRAIPVRYHDPAIGFRCVQDPSN